MSGTTRSSCVLITFALAVGLVVGETPRADELQPLLGGTALRAKLAESVPVVRWNGVPYRTALRRLADLDGIAVVLDRRIDPSRSITFEATGLSVAELFAGLAANGGAEVRTLGGTMYIGPPEPVARLRTLVRLRTDEALASFSGGEAAVASRRRTIRWNDLESPADVLATIAASYGVRIDGIDAIPHDLWGAGAIADATFAEALSMVLLQFDRTFSWNPDETAVTIGPIPDRVRVAETYAVPRGRTSEQVVADWRRELPGVTIEARGRRVEVLASLEEHERLREFLEGGSASGTKTVPEPGSRPSPPSPLDRQRFTLRLKEVPAAALIRSIEQQAGITFEFDARAFARAGVDLDQRIDVDAKDAPPDRFFRLVFDQLEVDFEIDGTVVRLEPRARMEESERP